MTTTRPHSRLYGRRDGLLDVQCWCGRKVIATDPDDVRHGKAPSCGAHCRPSDRPPTSIKERATRDG